MKLIKNYLYNVANQLFVLLIPLVTIPYISRVIGPKGVGINAFTNSIVSYFVLFGSIGIGLYGNRTIAYVRDNRKKVSQTFWEITLLKVITISIAYIAFFVFVFFYGEYKDFLMYQSFLILAAGIDISWLFMGLEDFKKTVVRNIMVRIISLICIFSFVKSSKDLIIYILILTLSTLFGNLTLWSYLPRTLEKVSFKDLNIFQHFIPSLHLFLPQIATQIYLVLNKTMLGQMSSIDSVGYYEYSDKIIKMILAIVTATGTVMLPRVANTFSKGNLEQVNKYLYISFNFVGLISFPLTFGIMGISSNFSTIFFGKEFLGIDTVIITLSLVIIAISMSNVLGTQYLLPTNQMKKFTLSVTIGAIVNLLLNLFMLSWWGAIGAAISTVISEFAVTLYQVYCVRDTVDVKHLFKDIWKYFIPSIIMFIIVFYIGNFIEGFVGVIIQIAIGFIIYVVLIIILKPDILIFGKNFVKEKINK